MERPDERRGSGLSLRHEGLFCRVLELVGRISFQWKDQSFSLLRKRILVTKIRAGKASHAKQPLPAVLGLDMAGTGVFTLLPLLTGEGQEHHGEILASATSIAEEGKLKPLLNANHFSTSDIDAAYAAVGSGSLGKVVIDIRHS